MNSWNEIEREFEEQFGGEGRWLCQSNEVLGYADIHEPVKQFLKEIYLRGRREGYEEAVEVVRTMADRHYPEDIWIPLPNNGKEILADIHSFLKEKGGGIDAVSAHYVRWVTKNVVKDLQAALEEKVTD